MQQEILELLKKRKIPMARTEIARALKERPEKISNKLSILLHYREVCYIEIDRFEALKRLGASKTTRLYYVPKKPSR